MVKVPALTPVTSPVLSTVALAVLLLVQVPPSAVLVSCVVEPAQTAELPAIAEGVIVTVTVAMAGQPDTI